MNRLVFSRSLLVALGGSLLLVGCASQRGCQDTDGRPVEGVGPHGHGGPGAPPPPEGGPHGKGGPQKQAARDCTPKPVANPDKVCRERFDKAKKSFDRKRDLEAQQAFRDLTLSCAGYDFTEEAQWLLAESHFRSEEWMEAETEYRLLLGSFERSPHLAEANWKMTLCSIRQASSWDRDPSTTQSALDRIESFLSDFPTSTWVEEARKQRTELRARLAQRLYQTARLYLRLKEPLAATHYYNELLKAHSDWSTASQARLELARAYALSHQFDQARLALDPLRSGDQAARWASEVRSTESFISSEEKDLAAKRARETEGARTGLF